MTRRSTVAAGCASALTLSLLAAVLAPASPARAAAPGPTRTAARGTAQSPASATVRAILRLAPRTGRAALVAGLTGAGARLVAHQRALDLAVVSVPEAGIAGLGALPFVRSVARDAVVTPQALRKDAAGQAGSLAAITETIGATRAWRRGITGAGVDVALLDTGVAPAAGLDDPTKVVIGPDLSFESQQVDVRSLDTYGHGTNMAGIIAGREGSRMHGSAYADDQDNFLGVAPDARIVSLKLADRNGAVDVSQMIAAIDWVAQNQRADGMNIRVLNISYGTPSRNDAQADPLSWAAESAWRAGVVVVASAGNEGEKPAPAAPAAPAPSSPAPGFPPTPGFPAAPAPAPAPQKGTAGLASPAYNPWVLAVGAADTKGTANQTDDTVPPFSQRATVAGQRGPDLVAPGVGVVSIAIPGSKLDGDHPAAKVGPKLLRGSGTSQASAVVSGAAALILQQYPWMTPDDVKGMLTRTASRLPNVPVGTQGAGELNLTAALSAPPMRSPQYLPWGHGTGPLDQTRGGNYVEMHGKKLTGERDVMGTPWQSWERAEAARQRNAWRAGGIFNSATWIGAGGMAVNTATWSGDWYEAWSGRVWKGDSWSGRVWKGETWSGQTWSGRRWTGADWDSPEWTAKGWSAKGWESPVEAPAWAGRVWTSELWK